MNTAEDELELRRLMDRYVDAANRKDGDAWGSTWAADGCWELAGNKVEGRDNIVGFWQQMVASFEFAIMMPSSGMFDVRGDEASGHWYLQEFTRDLEGSGNMLLSRYRDTYTRVEGQWLYQSRSYDVAYFGPGDLSGSYTAMS